MNALNIIALSKAVTTKAKSAARDEIVPGKVNVDFIAHIRGLLTVGEDFEQVLAMKADPWTLLALALSHLNGVTIDHLVRESVSGEINVDDIKRQADMALALIKAPTRSVCKGKVTAKLEVEIEELVTAIM